MAIDDYVVFISETAQLLVQLKLASPSPCHRALFLKDWHLDHRQLTHQIYLVKTQDSHTYNFANGRPCPVHFTNAFVRPVDVCNEAEVLPS